MRFPSLGPVSLIFLLLALVIAAPQLGGQASAVRFPDVTGDSLAKQTLHLPQDFGGNETLVLVAFARDQQKDVDTWTAPIAKVGPAHAGFRFYELPVLPQRDVLYRWWLNTGMRTGVSDDSARQRTVPLYVNKDRFKSELQIQTEKTITALLIGKDGTVQWRSTGAWTEEKQRALVYALDHHS